MKCSNLSAGISSSWKEFAGAEPALDGCSTAVFSEWALSKRSHSADEADGSSTIPSTGPGAHWGWTGAQERLLTDWASPSCYCFLSWHCRAEMNCCVLQGKLIQWDSSIPFMGEVLQWDLWLCFNTELFTSCRWILSLSTWSLTAEGPRLPIAGFLWQFKVDTMT